MGLIIDLLQIFILNLLEEWQQLAFHLTDGDGREQDCCNSVGTVFAVIKIDQIFFNFWMGKSAVVTDTVIVVGPTGEVFEDLPFSTVVFSESEHALFMDCLTLLLDAATGEKSLDEEIAESLNCLDEI